jgi:hypothetical protein
MKRLLITTILCGVMGGLFAQTSTGGSSSSGNTSSSASTNTSTADTSVKLKRFWKAVFIGKKKPSIDSLNRVKHHGFRFDFDLFSHYSLGLANLVDNGSLNLQPKNQFLNYTPLKTSYDSFEMLSFGYRFNNHFKIDLGVGFDWTLIRLQNDSINIAADKSTLTYTKSTVRYSKNRLSSNYLILPLTFGFRSDLDERRRRFTFEAAPEVGFLVDGMLKQESSEYGKVKNFNDFHFDKFKYGSSVRIGYGDVGLFGKYYFNDMFVNSPDQVGIKSFILGVTLDFD